jgi:hypothetical protein
MLTQYIRAQYHASTKNGNFLKRRLRKYPWNLLVFGLTTSFFQPNILSSRFLHLGSWGVSNDGEEARCWSSSNEEEERGLECPDEEGEWEGEYVRLRRPKSLYVVLRFTYVPPKRRVTTTSGSMKVPTPMMAVGEDVRMGSGRIYATEMWRGKV